MRLAVVFCLALAAQIVWGQPNTQLVFDRLHSGDGLSHNTVYAIHQDRDGFMWFGTLDGLNRYDGYEFVVYRHNPADPTSIANNVVRAIHEDADGTKWIGTDSGLCRMDYGEDVFACYDVPPHPQSGAESVNDIERDSTGRLWIASVGGLLTFDDQQNEFEAIQEMAGRSVSDLVLRPDGLWLLVSRVEGSTTTQTLNRIDLSSGSLAESWTISQEWGTVHAFAFDAAGGLWFSDLGPAIRDDSVLRPTVSGTPNGAWAALARTDGSVFLGLTPRGALLVCRVDSGCVPNRLDQEQTTWLSNFVRTIYEDRSGAVWVGTYTGVYRHDPHRKPFTVLRHSDNDSNTLNSDAISAIVRPPGSDHVWAATFDGGLNRIDLSTQDVARYVYSTLNPAGIPQGSVWDLHLGRRGAIWLAGSFGLVLFDPTTGQFDQHPAAQRSLGHILTTIEEEPDGTLWIGSFAGLANYDPHSREAVAYPITGDRTGPSLGVVSAMFLDGRTLWLGGDGGRVNRLNLDTGRFEHLQPTAASGEVLISEIIYDLASDGNGRILIGSGAGLFSYDPDSGQFQHLTPADGLPGSVVYTIQPGEDGTFWLGTNRGIAVFDGDSTILRTYDLSDGIGMMEFNRHARFMDENGVLYMGGGEGLIFFDPSGIRDNPVLPDVVITAIESSSRNGTTSYNPRGLAELVLPPGETSVTFTLAALSYTSPEKNEYAYILEGIDDDWVYPGTQRQVRYINLPPGSYTLRVRAANNDGVWNEVGLVLSVIVQPTFLQTLLFKLLILAAVIGGLFALYRIRVRRLLGVERLRLRIASDLHDDLSSDLSGIALASDILREHAYIDPADRLRLTGIHNSAVGMVDALRDIVWTINPEHDTLDAMVRRMRTVARQLLADIPYTFDADLPNDGKSIPMSIRRDLLLLYKEALHNVVRHAEATSVGITLGQKNSTLDLCVADNGKGFERNAVDAGTGLKSMERRAKRMGGTLTITSSSGTGSRVCVRVNMASSRDGGSS